MSSKDSNTGDGKLKTIAFLFVLVFVAGAFVQSGSSEEPKPIKPTPGAFPHYGLLISDTTPVIKQGKDAHLILTWWTYRKEEETPLENYTVEIENIRNEKGDEIPMPRGMEVTYYVKKDPEREPPYERKKPYETRVHVSINTSIDTPSGAYLFP